MDENSAQVSDANQSSAWIWLVLGVAALIGIFYVAGSSGPKTDTADEDTTAGHGRIYLSLVRPNEERFYPYVIDVANRELRKLDDGSEAIMLFHNFSDGLVSFIGTTVSEYEKERGALNKALQFYVAPATDQDIPTLADAVRVTNSDQYAKRAPDLSPNGAQLLYSALPREDSVILDDAEAWDVYIVSTQGGKPEFVTRGIFPKWLNDSQFVVLKNDGLHMFDVRSDTDEILWEVEGDIALSNMMLHVSENRRVIAWTAPDAGLLMVLRIHSLDPLEVSGNEISEVHGFWPVVSPDGDFVAIQAVDWGALETDPSPELRIYDTATLTLKGSTVDLSMFDQQRMFVTDWRE